MNELANKIEELWDAGDVEGFKQLEPEIKSKVSDSDVDGCVLLARFYYRFSLLHDEKANTSRQYWFDLPKYAENEDLWNKGEELINTSLDLIKKA
ncbi:MAG TPA: hypothetical protein VMX95_02050, partial [Thermodesulfobacteriota bacterium]|nr:hypothetical protein [Thermodesulfobacteriota bacterium]